MHKWGDGLTINFFTKWFDIEYAELLNITVYIYSNITAGLQLQEFYDHSFFLEVLKYKKYQEILLVESFSVLFLMSYVSVKGWIFWLEQRLC